MQLHMCLTQYQERLDEEDDQQKDDHPGYQYKELLLDHFDLSLLLYYLWMVRDKQFAC